MKRFTKILFFLIYFSFAFSPCFAKSTIFVINIKKEIGSTTWVYLQNGIKQAEKENATAILLHINTYGGTVLHADSMRTAILRTSIPVYAFIDNNAASAGALIAIACDSIYMRNGANIGAATVVNQTGEEMPDKYQSYMRATIRATAEAHGYKKTIIENDSVIVWHRDPLIAEAMVDHSIVVPGLIDSTKVLTFTAMEAKKWGYCEGIYDNIDQIATQALHFTEYQTEQYTPSFYEEIKGFVTNPAFQAILIMLIMGGIYFEMQTPGVGFPLIIAISAAILYFAPYYIDGLAQNWEILLFIIGIGLLLAEFFVIPGFGIAGISGFILMGGALILAAIDNNFFDFSGVSSSIGARAILVVGVGIVGSVFLVIYLSYKIGSKGAFARLALDTTLEKRPHELNELETLIKKQGIAVTPLRPSGKIDIATTQYDAISTQGFIEKGSHVEVVKYQNNQLYVKKIISKHDA